MPQNLLDRINVFNPFKPQPQPRQRPMDDYVPQREMQDRFNSHLDNMPQLNKPSKFKSIMGALAALNSDNPQATADSIKHAPYMREMERWKSLNPVLNTAVDNERDYNTNQRILRRDQEMEEYRRGQLTRQETRDAELARAAQVREETNNRSVAVRERLADLKALTDSKANFKPFTGEDGYVYLQDMQNPNSPATRTEIKTGDLSDTQKLSIGLANSLRVLRERGEQTQDNATHATALGITRDALRPGGNNGNAQLEETRARVNRANQVRSQFPELNKYISIDGNTVTIPELRKPMFGEINPTEAANRKRAYDMIFGESVAPPTPPDSATIAAPFPVRTPPTTSANQQPSPKIRVRRKADGKEGSISEGAFNPNLYERIQ